MHTILVLSVVVAIVVIVIVVAVVNNAAAGDDDVRPRPSDVESARSAATRPCCWYIVVGNQLSHTSPPAGVPIDEADDHDNSTSPLTSPSDVTVHVITVRCMSARRAPNDKVQSRYVVDVFPTRAQREAAGRVIRFHDRVHARFA